MLHALLMNVYVLSVVLLCAVKNVSMLSVIMLRALLMNVSD
jgi:hypothetical protein